MAEQKNPFGESTAGQNAFRAAYDRLKAESEASRGNIAQDYSGAYQQLRGQTYQQGLGAAAQRGLSGGQAAQASNRLSAAQMGALGGLLQGQERALREQKAGEASIYSNALLEGQQAQQMQQQTEQYNFQRDQQTRSVLDDNTLSNEEKTRSLQSLGYTPEQIEALLKTSPTLVPGLPPKVVAGATTSRSDLGNQSLASLYSTGRTPGFGS
jgi:hypothetical protein